MNVHAQVAPETTQTDPGGRLHRIDWERMGVLYARIAVGAAFLSAVGGRFGLWDRAFDLKHFANFLEYAGEVLSFMPRAAVPYLAWAATICETSFGILLILGLWTRWVALGSAILLAMFATAMAISFGLKSPMDYSVYSASGAAVLLALDAFRRSNQQASNKI
ncbi:MAG TPA: DoxX family protein [Terriglobales bacterium]|nr:DoxX family protein [Terriglobales bacterium]